MLSSKIKDIKIRNSLKRVEKIKRVKKFLFTALVNKEGKEDSTIRSSIILSFLKDKKNISYKSKIRMTNRCVLTNRGRGVLRPYGISRTVMRDLMQFGIIPGYSKAVW
jgi:small subunit ribosomal protein S14